MVLIILTTSILNDMLNNHKLKILKKPQKIENNFNYFFSPKIGFNIYRPDKIYFNEKYITIRIDKKNNIDLHILLNNIHQKIKNYTNIENLYNIFVDKDDYYTIRCILPKKNKFDFNIDLNTITVEIKNIWQLKDKSGYNLEIKKIE